MKASHILRIALIFATLPLTAMAEKDAWTPLFNGKDLTGWTPKFKGYDLGVNARDTFRVEDGVIKVSYENYKKFDQHFGHLFTKSPYSHYLLRVEYRFTGDQVEGGPGWAFRNSGIMLHCQEPKTMRKDQNFPVSVEVQLLGGAEKGDRPTANLCTPGTHVFLDGKLNKRHCTNSKSETLRGDQWVTVEVEVHGGKEIIHRVNGKEVLRYSKPVLDDRDADAKKLIKGDKKLQVLTGGYISIQAESHPCEFRKIEIKELKD